MVVAVMTVVVAVVAVVVVCAVAVYAVVVMVCVVAVAVVCVVVVMVCVVAVAVAVALHIENCPDSKSTCLGHMSRVHTYKQTSETLARSTYSSSGINSSHPSAGWAGLSAIASRC